MANLKSPNMNEKAANYGDRLKRALLLETLHQTDAWSSVNYAETHAGAGVYQAGEQRKDSFICNLRQQVENVEASARGAGVPYLKWLKDWWSVPANSDRYPGSALTALHWLKCRRPPQMFRLRVTEKDATTCSRLRQALGSYAQAAKEESFVSELDWLTADDSLVLLVDPFGCVTTFDNTTSGRGFDNGWIDHNTIRNVLERCAGKECAVLSFWWGFGQALRNHHDPTCRLVAEWAQQQIKAECRVFHDNRNHANALIGIGEGAELVRRLPSRQNWRDSWLADVIYERL